MRSLVVYDSDWFVCTTKVHTISDASTQYDKKNLVHGNNYASIQLVFYLYTCIVTIINFITTCSIHIIMYTVRALQSAIAFLRYMDEFTPVGHSNS